ncbi:MAG: hypothetical protein A3G25_09290 [Betaproteobacteria bacterium RIFCSPLOWO2_12_FULL_63_13]|nr:MAG: hypothetical protein A3G25_09290 [Betaproteobacteria bacterium RIFCSPLOWO2_12_FULL_63_13]
MAAFAAALAGAAHAQQAARISTPATGSVFHTIGVAISDMARKHANINSTVQPGGGSAAAMNGIAAKRFEFALSSAYIAATAYQGGGRFKKPIAVRLIMQGQPSYRGMMVNKDANIRSFKDLIGATIAADRPALPDLNLVFRAMAKVYGVPMDKFKVIRTTTLSEQEAAVRSGSAKAAVFGFGARAATIARVLGTGAVVPFYMSESERDRLLGHLPKAMHWGKVPAGVWPEQTEDWHLVAMNALFVARGDVPAETVYQFVKAVLDHTDEFKTYHAAARAWTVKHSLDDVPLPFHEGAIRYYKEKGAWNSTLDAEQKGLLAGK